MEHPYQLMAFFGEAQKGEFKKGYFCRTLYDLMENLGEPPSNESQGLRYAIQALLFERRVLFFRVHEEGFSVRDYLQGLDLLQKEKKISPIAICLPGVGDHAIIDATEPICTIHQSFLILTQKDLYDYLTSKA